MGNASAFGDRCQHELLRERHRPTVCATGEAVAWLVGGNFVLPGNRGLEANIAALDPVGGQLAANAGTLDTNDATCPMLEVVLELRKRLEYSRRLRPHNFGCFYSHGCACS